MVKKINKFWFQWEKVNIKLKLLRKFGFVSFIDGFEFIYDFFFMKWDVINWMKSIVLFFLNW